METKARTLINKFKKVRSRDSLKLAALPQDEDDNLPNDLIQLKYLADAGVPEAILAYARLCFIGRYVPVNKPHAFSLVSKLLEKVSTPDRLEWVRDNLNDGFIAEVIQYRYQHQYGTAHAHKWWVWANQARLNFTRIAVIAKVGALDEVTKHPSYASLAFVMFTVRFFGDLFVLINTAYRDKEERKLQGNFKWFVQFIKKDDKYLRYLNDIVWACLGVVGFTMFMVGLEGLAPAIPLVLGYLFDVGVEIYRAVLQYKNLTKEAAFLGDQIEECIAKIATLESAPMTADNEKDLKELNERVGLFNVQLNEIMNKRSRKALRSLLIVTNTFLLFAGMFIAKLIPLMTTINPLIGFGVVLAASGLIFIHKLIESIVDYREQKLVKKIDKAIEANDRLMEIAFEEKVKDTNNNLIVNLNKKPSFIQSRKTRVGYSIFGKPRNARGEYSRLDNKNSEAIHSSKLG